MPVYSGYRMFIHINHTTARARHDITAYCLHRLLLSTTANKFLFNICNCSHVKIRKHSESINLHRELFYFTTVHTIEIRLITKAISIIVLIPCVQQYFTYNQYASKKKICGSGPPFKIQPQNLINSFPKTSE